MCFSLQISFFFYQIWLTLSARSFRSYLFNISCWKDANFALTLAQPPVVLLLVVDVDHVAVADAQLVVPGRQGEDDDEDGGGDQVSAFLPFALIESILKLELIRREYHNDEISHMFAT